MGMNHAERRQEILDAAQAYTGWLRIRRPVTRRAEIEFRDITHPTNITALIQGYDALLVQARKDALEECWLISETWYEGGSAKDVADEIRALIDTPAPETK